MSGASMQGIKSGEEKMSELCLPTNQILEQQAKDTSQ